MWPAATSRRVLQHVAILRAAAVRGLAPGAGFDEQLRQVRIAAAAQRI
jgi:hypothetical protein